MNSRNRRSLPAVSKTGTVGEGWNLTELTSASDLPAWLESRKPMMSRVVGGRSRGRSDVFMISVVECRRFSTASSESDWKDSSDAVDSRLRFLRGSCSFSRAETAQDGVGLMRSNLEHEIDQRQERSGDWRTDCCRSLLSYSLPVITSCSGPSRSFRSRLSFLRDTLTFVSEGSIHAGP